MSECESITSKLQVRSKAPGTSPSFYPPSGVIYCRVQRPGWELSRPNTHVRTQWLSQRANTRALRRKQRFQMKVDNKSCYSSFCLRAGDTTFLSRVSLTHIVVVTVSNNKGPSPVQRREDYCLFEKGSFFSFFFSLFSGTEMSLSQLISFLLVQIWSVFAIKTAEVVWELCSKL